MSNVYFPYSKAPLRTVREIQFGLLSPEEIKRMSVVHVEYPETMVSVLLLCRECTPVLTSTQDEQRQRPRAKGPNDTRLGTLERQFYCETCEEGQKECPGHFGHIELATPVFHVGMHRPCGYA